MLIADHINLHGPNPLVGAMTAVGPRFVAMTDAYDPALRARACNAAARRARHRARTRASTSPFSGPSFETPAEIRAYRDARRRLVGMSTVPEVILARHCGLRVAAISVVTNWRPA